MKTKEESRITYYHVADEKNNVQPFCIFTRKDVARRICNYLTWRNGVLFHIVASYTRQTRVVVPDIQHKDTNKRPLF